MNDLPSLFTEHDLASLQTTPYGVGSFIRIAGLQQGRVVAPDPFSRGYWLVKLAGGQVVTVKGDSFS